MRDISGTWFDLVEALIFALLSASIGMTKATGAAFGVHSMQSTTGKNSMRKLHWITRALLALVKKATP